MPQFSIIIPTYNSSKYISKCITSIINQQFPDFECIIVNDGSTDNTIELCHSIIKEDPRFFIIENPKNGVSSARNAGLDRATGNYVLFVDSDDWVEPTLLQTLIQKGNNADIIQFDFYQIADNSKNKLHLNSNFNLIVQSEGTVVWKRAFKKEIIEKVRFNESIHGGEDYIFTIQAFLNSKSYQYLSDCLYNYNTDNQESIMHTNDMENFTHQLLATNEVEKILKQHNIYQLHTADIRKRYHWCLKEMCYRWISLSSRSDSYKRISCKLIKKILKRHI